MVFNDKQLLRYSRHILLPEIAVEGQEKLYASKVLIVGVGGLGSPAALYLAASGVGQITIADPDIVELNNLQRQIVHHELSLGQAKVESAADSMRKINSEINVIPLQSRLQAEELDPLVATVNLVLDCSDNLSTRFAINKACVNNKKPLVSAAAIRWEGQISVYHSGYQNSPCYHCFYGGSSDSDQSCSKNGVLSPVVGVLGSMQAIEAIKLLTDCGDNLIGRVLLLDALSMQWESMQLPKNPSCEVCGNRDR